MNKIISWIKGKAVKTTQVIMAHCLYIMAAFYNLTIRVRFIGKDKVENVKKDGKPVLYAIWHGAGYFPMWCLRNKDITLYTSFARTRKKGLTGLTKFKRDMWHKGFRMLGFRTIDAVRYGATETGGVKRFVGELAAGHSGMIAVDGPNGPHMKAKPGAAYLAGKTGAVIIPVASYATRKRIRAKQWDKLFVPGLFAKGAVVFGDPVEVPADADENMIQKVTRRLEETLNALTRQAEVAAEA